MTDNEYLRLQQSIQALEDQRPLLGDAVVSLWLTTHADRIGRRRVLAIGALLVLAAGLAFAATPVFALLLVAATIGVISPSGNEVGPFLSVEQAALSQIVPDRERRPGQEPGHRVRQGVRLSCRSPARLRWRSPAAHAPRV